MWCDICTCGSVCVSGCDMCSAYACVVCAMHVVCVMHVACVLCGMWCVCNMSVSLMLGWQAQRMQPPSL